VKVGDLVKYHRWYACKRNNQLNAPLIIGIIVEVHDGLTLGDKGYHTVLIDGERYSIATRELELISASR
jgi:hypothetical protein